VDAGRVGHNPVEVEQDGIEPLRIEDDVVGARTGLWCVVHRLLCIPSRSQPGFARYPAVAEGHLRAI